MQTLLSQPVVDSIKHKAKETAIGLVDAGVDPQLAVVLVGNNEDSLRYISIKSRMAKEVGVILSLYHLEAGTPYEEVEKTVRFLSEDPDMHGVIIQLPLPEQFTAEQTDTLLKLVPAEKDVDGLAGNWQQEKLQAATLQELLQPLPALLPPMISSVLSLLDYYKISIKDKKTVVVGKGRLVGTPLEQYLQKLGVDVETVDEETAGILDTTKTADILISATGQKDLITYQWIKEGAVVIDCAQDIHEDSVTQVASALAPSRGGVGPLTVIWLLYNTIQAALTSSGGIHV